MKKFLGILFLLLTVPSFVWAEDAAKLEVFGGYQYFRLDTGVSGLGSPFSLNGWNASATGYFNKYLGFTADFAGAYGTPTISFVGVDTKVHTFMFGPVVRLSNPTRLTPFVHALGGGVHTSIVSAFGSPSETDAVWAIGGGVDANFAPRISIRLGQFDYLQSFVGNAHQNNFRYSAGIVFKF
jgi:opacity protein-like surface antigen